MAIYLANYLATVAPNIVYQTAELSVEIEPVISIIFGPRSIDAALVGLRGEIVWIWVLTKVEKKKNRNSWPEATINCSKLDTIAKKIAGILNKGIVKCQELGDNNSSLCINFKRNERSPGSSLTLILTRSKNSFSLLFSFLKKKKKKDGVIIRATRVFGPDFLEIQIFRAVLVERWLRTVRKYILAHGRRHGCRYDNR